MTDPELGHFKAFMVAVHPADDSEVLGYAGLSYDNSLARMCVRGDQRRKGLATMLVTAVADCAREGGATLLKVSTLSSNSAAVTLYGKTFDREAGREIWKEGELWWPFALIHGLRLSQFEKDLYNFEKL